MHCDPSLQPDHRRLRPGADRRCPDFAGLARSLADDALASRVMELVGRSHVNEAALLAHLGEVEARELHLRAACSSLFTYCTDVLKLSEDAASNRAVAGTRPGGHEWS